MKRNVTYEWGVEFIDPNSEEEEIMETIHFASLKDAFDFAAVSAPYYMENVNPRFVLIRDVGNQVEGLTDRAWAYLNEDGLLPEYFEYTDGCADGPKVPKRFHKEMEKFREEVQSALETILLGS